MKWEEFIKLTRNLPVIDAEILLAGMPNPKPAKVQISRWQKAGKLIQLKRGLYLLGEAYHKIEAYEPYIAATLKKPSYISLEKALEYHNLIPEAVPVYTSITTKRQGKFNTKTGVFDYRHIKNSLFWGYKSITTNNQTGFIASAEKALLDLFYLRKPKVSLEYLQELRLQNVKQLDINKLLRYAEKFKKPGIIKAAKTVQKYILTYTDEEKTL